MLNRTRERVMDYVRDRLSTFLELDDLLHHNEIVGLRHSHERLRRDLVGVCKEYAADRQYAHETRESFRERLHELERNNNTTRPERVDRRLSALEEGVAALLADKSEERDLDAQLAALREEVSEYGTEYDRRINKLGCEVAYTNEVAEVRSLIDSVTERFQKQLNIIEANKTEE